MTCSLIQIVAGLPPAIDGVGDYALTIARGLRELQAIETLFVVANPTWRGPRFVDGFPVVRVARKHAASMRVALREVVAGARAGPTTPALLHCSLYGYARRALAFWLRKGLVQWKRESPESELITMFHELSARGPIWTSPFWLHRIQSGLIRDIAQASAATLTSNACYRQHLAQIAGIEESRIVKLPVLSTVGEPSQLLPTRTRKRQLVVFGRRPSRDLVFSRFLPLLAPVCRVLGIDRILELGPDPSEREHGLPATIETTGVLPRCAVSAILRESLFGFIALDARMLSKSSVFAAYCSHGTVPLVVGTQEGEDPGGEADGLFANQHYLRVPLEAQTGGYRLDAISRSAHAWYRAHGVAVQASHYASILDQISGAGRAAGERYHVAT